MTPAFERGQLAADVEEGEIDTGRCPRLRENGAVKRLLAEDVKPIERGEERGGGGGHRQTRETIRRAFIGIMDLDCRADRVKER